MAFRFFAFVLNTQGNQDSFLADIYGVAAPLDRSTRRRSNAKFAAFLSLDAKKLGNLPLDYDGVVFERSDDGISFSDISGVVRDVHFFIDCPTNEQIYYYRARAKNTSGLYSDYGNTIELDLSAWSDLDDLGVSEVQALDGALVDRLNPNDVFPLGIEGSHEGVSLHEGSLLGGFTGGLWMSTNRETEAPVYSAVSPLCGDMNVSLPLSSIQFTLQDYPYPSGGSGIDDGTFLFELSVSSQDGGAFKSVRVGALEPFSPDITCLISATPNPLLDRTVEILLPLNYVKSEDLVQLRVSVKDFDGNVLQHLCTFQAEFVDEESPTVESIAPLCGSGIDNEDFVRLDAPISLSVRDNVQVDVTSIQMYLGTSNAGPWTQVLQNGATFLLGYSGSVTVNAFNGFDVLLLLPASTLWSVDSQVCYRILAQDTSGNAVEKICCFKTAPQTYLQQIIPIAENLVLLKFSQSLSRNAELTKTQNYQIESLDGNADITVHDVTPQGEITLQSIYVDPEERKGLPPRFILLRTTVHAFHGRYRLTALNLRDEYGTLLSVQSFYRGRRTKIDEIRSNMKDTFTLQGNTVQRALLMALSFIDEQVGGVFLPDDWENE